MQHQCNTTACKVKFRNQLSESFEVNTYRLETRWCAVAITFKFSPWKSSKDNADPSRDGNLKGNSILKYADNIMVMGNTCAEVITKTDNLIKAAKPMRLKVNQDKTKYMVSAEEIKIKLVWLLRVTPSKR